VRSSLDQPTQHTCVRQGGPPYGTTDHDPARGSRCFHRGGPEHRPRAYRGKVRDRVNARPDLTTLVRSSLGQLSPAPPVGRAMRTLLMLSLFDGPPVAALEAVQAGMPITASHTGSRREIVQDGLSGWLFSGASLDRVATEIAPVTHRDWRRPGKAGRRIIAKRLTARPIGCDLSDAYQATEPSPCRRRSRPRGARCFEAPPFFEDSASPQTRSPL
jgi:glycosyltransferase involved in cell wall biosynthesis